ncbi:unnamed protein product [Adineta steineri]|uniref:MULE transposase domain-containing protein n=1 Tax=Adineta steineri TaxID=433720 RepID=A0A815VA22_9BILA|nr:unnamed protein product [Adineta steineri]CAF1329194.1 unnamed protein product [Adineta steineri]CAF1533158.1 unnamed protein product [Adineta steineri]CAF1588718.1 unnamed protein product [Adineta steineri]
MSHININQSQLNDESISYIKSTHEINQLIYHGARFCVKQKNLSSILWRCVKGNCPASISISNNNIVLRKNENHNHLIDSNEIKVLELRHKLKKDAQSSSEPIDKIVELGYSNMVTTHKINDSVVKFPTMKTLKNTVSRQRRQIRPPLPKSLDDLPHPLPPLYTITKKKLNFLLYDGILGQKRGLIFASQNDIEYLAYQKFWYGDGTFYTSPSIFYQIYSIHTFDEGLSTPCVFALLPDKFESTYLDLFSILIKKIMEISNIIRLECITIDYELAVKNVFCKHFPHVEVKGCLFHYGQALFRKFVSLNLTTPFKEDESLRLWFRSFAAIALLPETDMDEAIEYLRSIKPLLYEKEIDSFLEYHNNTYGINSRFPPKMYNHYRNLKPRTINYLEGRHNRWKKRSTKSHHDIYICIDMFKIDQLLAADGRERHEAGAAPPKRRKNTRIAEESLSRLWDKLEKDQITKEKFLKGAGLRYFQYLEIE